MKYTPEKCLICGKRNAIIWTCDKCSIPKEANTTPSHIPANQYSLYVAEKIKKYVKEQNSITG